MNLQNNNCIRFMYKT